MGPANPLAVLLSRSIHDLNLVRYLSGARRFACHLPANHLICFKVAGTTVLLWDTLLTFPDEVQRIWSSILSEPISPADLGYLFQRYTSCAISILFLSRT